MSPMAAVDSLFLLFLIYLFIYLFSKGKLHSHFCTDITIKNEISAHFKQDLLRYFSIITSVSVAMLYTLQLAMIY